MGFRTRCKFCPRTEFGNTATYRRHVKWHVSRGDAVVMVNRLRRICYESIPIHSGQDTMSLMCKPEEVPELERQGWIRKPTTTEETPE